MAAPQASLRLQADQAAHARAAQLVALREWAKVSERGDWEASWLALVPRVAMLVALAQNSAAQAAAASVPLALAEQGGDPASEYALNSSAFAGWMQSRQFDGDAVPLESALGAAPVVQARAVGSLSGGANTVALLVQTAVADASRSAVQAQTIASRGTPTFYEPGKACSRCAVLVGKQMPLATDFHRHPKCDGVLVPVPTGQVIPFDSMKPDRITNLTLNQKRAVDDGASLDKVLHAVSDVRGGPRDMHSPLYADGTKTLVGAGRKKAKTVRLTPKGIYRMAGDDREEAVRLLEKYGYLARVGARSA